MRQLSHQYGVGLIEVMVAVLLLSIAVLGFSALQVRAVSATDESLVRTKSLTLVRNLAEVMRAYPDAYVTGSGTAFTTSTSNVTGAIPLVQAVASIPSLASSASGVYSATIDGTPITINGTNNCLSTGTKTVDRKKVPTQSCNINQLAARDTLLVKQIAREEDIRLAVIRCPADVGQATIQQQMCVIAAWNDTKPLLTDENTGANANACANSNGVYKNGSQCLISEAY
ncbi:type IV pilus modification protein PilV [Psychrobacter okhotskensis]|uniref:type IV pilus modification protein PilV n=1 Tax=Psychrobacter okhotskensis TaxID=212403 RepID=UPI001563AF34|nr:type IV pilus modification protein PilV [Psychrobacter okhotskensis]NRD69708.1 type IV pilus modification protein PilV [Psychrobacter okhotskensis]